MDMINSVVTVLLILSSLFLIVTILMHSGRGSGLSDMFGGTSTPIRRHGARAHPRPDHRRHRDHLRAPQPVDRLAVEPVRGPSTDC
jgi:Preprotein translocase SecG subunit